MREAKHQIRQALHPQLADLRGQHDTLQWVADSVRGVPTAPGKHGAVAELAAGYRPDFSPVGKRHRIGGFEFVPLIIGALRAVCELDILFLRRERPGNLIRRAKDEYGGDLDNRIKILLDALRAPHEEDELPPGVSPLAHESPFYCLLEDDSLITRFAVESDTLYGGAPTEPKDVHLVIRVTIRITEWTLFNRPFAL